MYQAGTLSGNPVATACGLATLREIAQPGFYDQLAARALQLVEAWRLRQPTQACPSVPTAKAGMFGFSCCRNCRKTTPEVLTTDGTRFNQLFHGPLERGIYIAPALYEAGSSVQRTARKTLSKRCKRHDKFFNRSQIRAACAPHPPASFLPQKAHQGFLWAA